jgi:SAM-dependent methyltransferase
MVEWALGGPLGYGLNALLKSLWRMYWRTRYRRDRQTRFRLLAGSQAPFSKSHGHPTEQIILREYRRRLYTWGLAREAVHSQGAFSDYYEKVAAYYNIESELFEQHYYNNAILQRLRQDFRRITEKYSFRSCLEIGCGTGMDLLYFAEKYPGRCIRGIDVSPGMWRQARANLEQVPEADVRADIGTPEDLDLLYPGQRFELIYCYFGALNTVPDLEATAAQLRAHLTERGVLVLTFVNRWFVFEILWNMIRLRFRHSVARLRPVWNGYAPLRPLASHCRSAREVKKAFAPLFTLTERRGYSILFPAWFRHRFIHAESRLGRALWQIDRLLNKTLFWNCGEYSLYVFKPR